MLLSEIEDSCGPDYCFELYNPKFYYRNAHTGMYRMAKRLNYCVDYVQSRDVEKFKEYKVLYVPYGSMICEETVKALADFAKSGGVLLLDEGFAMREQNTWMNPYELHCQDILSVRMRERRETAEFAKYKEKSIRLRPYKSEYEVADAETMMTFADGKPALHKATCGKGIVYLSGFSIGYAYYETADETYEEMFEDLVREANLSKQVFADFKNGIYESVLEGDDATKITFLFNGSEDEKAFGITETVVCFGGDFVFDGQKYILKNNQIGYIITRG